jgi:hypothetical protein
MQDVMFFFALCRRGISLCIFQTDSNCNVYRPFMESEGAVLFLQLKSFTV